MRRVLCQFARRYLVLTYREFSMFVRFRMPGQSMNGSKKGNPFLAGMYRYSGFQAVRPKIRAVVVGGGFIGLETAENLVHRGFEVTLVEMPTQVLPPLDKDARV